MLPTVESISPCTLFATDGSLEKTSFGPIGSCAIVDSFGHSYSDSPDLGLEPSSTAFELAAICTLFSSILRTQLTNTAVIILIDSLSAINLCAGKDIRMKDHQTLRNIDERATKLLNDRNVKIHFIHVRSHRRIMVELNDLADQCASRLLNGVPSALPKNPTIKCKAECMTIAPCSACAWNAKVQEFVSKLKLTQLQLPLWSQAPITASSSSSSSLASALSSTLSCSLKTQPKCRVVVLDDDP